MTEKDHESLNKSPYLAQLQNAMNAQNDARFKANAPVWTYDDEPEPEGLERALLWFGVFGTYAAAVLALIWMVGP